MTAKRYGNKAIGWLLATLLLFATAAPAEAAYGEAGRLVRDLRTVLTTPDPAIAVDGDRLDLGPVTTFYRQRNYRPLWLEGASGAVRLRALLDSLSEAGRHGLNPGDYPGDAIRRRFGDASAADQLAMELTATAAFLRYADDVGNGRLSPAVDPKFFLVGKRTDAESLLTAAAEATNFPAFLDSLAPKNREYADLVTILERYRALTAAGGWPEFPEGPTLKPGMTDPTVPILRRRLAIEDVMAETTVSGDPKLYEGPVVEAVKRFQARQGLEIDGVVGRNTRAALNVPASQRIQQIIVNMERWRWMPDDLGERYILVNLAGYRLEVVEQGAPVLTMRVIVGKTYRQTPVFSDRMTYLDINPYWTVPPRLARQDILPKQVHDPGYLADQGIRVFSSWSSDARELNPTAIDWASYVGRHLPYRLRQDPGPKNALGQIKFMFPNEFDVYLHDTPSRQLFQRAVRTFSSGCIRVEKPLDLAEYLLGSDPKWTRETIQEAIADKKRKTVILPDPIPVHITYSTVWRGEDGTVQFRPDIYERDALLAQALTALSAGGPL